MITGLLTVFFLTAEPQNFTQDFTDLASCKAKAETIIPKLNKNPDVIGVAFVCTPAGVES